VANLGIVEYLVVAGGGAGGGSGAGDAYGSAGGGAGGLRTATGHTVTAQNYSITVGAAVAGTALSANGANGNNSVFDTITATGGGGGGRSSTGVGSAGNNGGSGGGGAGDNVGRAGGLGNTPATTPSQGSNGGAGKGNTSNGSGGGGGGASQVGAAATNQGNGGNGGAGTQSSITGTSLYYAAGGGGGAYSGTKGTGGSSIGGDGGDNVPTAPTSGLANTGSGGGGCAGHSRNQTSGGGASGIVIIRYKTDGSDGIDASLTTGGTKTTSGIYTIHTFTANGTFTVVLSSGTIGVLSGSTTGASAGTSSASALAIATANTGGSSAGQSTTSAQAQALGGSSWVKHANSPLATNIGGYWMFTPAGAGPETPMLICLHGLGDQGDGSSSQLDLIITHGFAKLINDRLNTALAFQENIICIFPQYIGTPISGYYIQNMIDYVKANFTFDHTKLHLSGYSNGAACVVNWWEVGNLEDVASCSLVATSLGYSSTAAPRVKAVNMPCLFNHGTLDTGLTDFQQSVGWRDGLNALGISPLAVLDDMPGEYHNVDITVYDWTWYNPVSGLTQLQWHLQYQRVPGTDTSGSASGTSTATATVRATINTTAVASGTSSASAAARSIASTTGAASGTSTASIYIGITTINTSGASSGTSATSLSVIGRANVLAAASGTTISQALAIAICNTAAASGGSSVAFALSQYATIVNTSGLADGVSSASLNAFGLLIIPQIISASSRIRSTKSGDSIISSTFNAYSKI